jgi:recombination protein RecA
MQTVDELARSGVFGLVLVDSVSALIPRAELEREMGDPSVGTQARLMSVGLKRIAQAASRHKCTVIFINQLRMKIGVMFGNPEVRVSLDCALLCGVLAQHISSFLFFSARTAHRHGS